MAVFRRSKTGPYWFAFTFRGERVQESTKQFNKQAAKDIESAYRTALAKNEVGIREQKVERLKVGQLLDRRLADLRERGKNGGRCLSAKKDLGAYWADELTGDDLNRYFREQRALGYAVGTITNWIAEVSSAYRLAGLKPPKLRQLSRAEKDNARTGFFSNPEFEAVCAEIPEELRDFCRFGYLTGWRFGSITKLRWADIDEGEVNLPGQFSKNGAPQKMPLTDDLAELIARREHTRVVGGAQLSALVFHKNGKPIKQSWFRVVWVDACLAAGKGKLVCPACGSETFEHPWQRCSHCRKRVEYVGKLFHDFRRSAARDMIRAGVPQSVAMKITGHKTDAMFRRYNIVDTDGIKEALTKTAMYRATERGKVRAIKAR